MIRLCIVDDDLRLARQVATELDQFPDFESIQLFEGPTPFFLSLQALPAANLPHCVLMDISMSAANEGIKATYQLRAQYPTVRTIMFTIADDDEHIFEAFRAGALGYLLKNEQPVFIVKAIQDVLQGGALMSPGVALKTIRFFSGYEDTAQRTEHPPTLLSARELEILRHISQGKRYQRIADELFISVQTVKKHMSNIFAKLQVTNKIEALNKSKEIL